LADWLLLYTWFGLSLPDDPWEKLLAFLAITWTTGVTITNKSLQLVGCGIDQTIITRNTASDYTTALQVTLQAITTNTFYMSGITWKTVNNPAGGIVTVGTNNAAGQPVSQFRIHKLQVHSYTD
jgi:hypothetical protein